MRPWKPWIVLASLAAFAGHAAVVYKWTDSDGVIHYSDQPVPGAEKIFTASSPTPGGSGASGRTSGPAGSGSKKNVAPGLNYAQFSITSPLPEQTFFGDDVVSVHLTVEPSLKQGQTITWHLNGRQVEDLGPVATQFALPHLDRGTYALAATITDQTTGESASTDSVTFYVRQPSALSPQHQKP
jgi:Domain of unknown function (DUF4124)